MGNISCNEVIKNIINANFDNENLTKVFELVKSCINFEEAYIVFFNPDSISIKYTYPYNEELCGTNIKLKSNLMKKLFSTKTDFLMKEELNIELPFKHANSMFLSKLFLKNTVYGAIIFASKNSGAFNDIYETASTIASVLAYKIKDKELSEIFKVQINALQESFIKSKKDYKTIKEQNAKILQVDKVKSEFLANITHELRTPLNAIIGFSEMLNTKLLGELNLKQEEYIGDIYVSGVHLLGMINEILDISKIESNAMTLNRNKFEISRAIDEVYNVVKPLAMKKDIKLTKTVKNIEVNADFQKTKQILYNLVSNAIKFTDKSGNIEVLTDFDKNFFYITVKDDGIGIAEKDFERIFEKFVQLENTYTKTESATGLGLTITKKFVNMHNGTISVESELKKGSKFKVKIPLV